MLTQRYDETLKETLFEGIHKSGLKVYVLPKKGYSKSYALFATKYGSVDSSFIIPGETQITEVPDGIAHFLEHKMFEEQEGNVFDQFSRLGSSPNAFTSFNMTAYLFSCTDHFYDNLNILLKFVQNPYFTDENVQKEQGIIGQEIRMYEDNPNWKVFFNFLGALYHNHPVKKDIAGTLDSISHINKDVLYKCYNTFYHPSNMILFIVGDIDPEQVESCINKNIDKESPLEDEIKRIYPDEPVQVKQAKIEQNLSVSIPLFQMGFKDTDTGYDGKKLLKKDITMRIILEMLLGRSTLLYQSLYEQGLINNTFDVDFTAEKHYGYTIFGGESINPEQVQQEILQVITKFQNGELDKEVFERIKKVIFSRFLRQFNSIERLTNNFVANLFKDIHLFDYIDVYQSITFKDVEDLFKGHFRPENMVLSVIRPISGSNNL